jgi:hypothetical protein
VSHKRATQKQRDGRMCSLFGMLSTSVLVPFGSSSCCALEQLRSFPAVSTTGELTTTKLLLKVSSATCGKSLGSTKMTERLRTTLWDLGTSIVRKHNTSKCKTRWYQNSTRVYMHAHSSAVGRNDKVMVHTSTTKTADQIGINYSESVKLPLPWCYSPPPFPPHN